MTTSIGPVILFGSGETAPSGRRVYEELFRTLPAPLHPVILETPAGFELNSDWVAAQVATFWTTNLQNYKPTPHIIPARRKNTAFSPDDPTLLTSMHTASLLFSGAGSPSYAVRQYRDSLAWATLCARHLMGTPIVFASASALAASRYTLPIYEIYKAGHDLHWIEGLDFFGDFGLSLVFIPHWNNRDGGNPLDTSRCYMGQSRFEVLRAMLPASDVTIVGLDEHTALWVDMATASCHVYGKGAVTLLHGDVESSYSAGVSFAVTELGAFHLPATPTIPPTTEITPSPDASPPAEILALLADRQAARAARNWDQADALRAALLMQGWLIHDTPDGPVLTKVKDGERM